MYVCGLGDERALFLKKRENPPSAGSDSGLRPPQGQKSVLEQMGAFSIYFCIKVMSGYCFDGNHRPGLFLRNRAISRV